MDRAAVPDFGAGPVIGRRFAPTRWRLDPGYALLPRALSGVPVM
jgi:hypothetical protein